MPKVVNTLIYFIIDIIIYNNTTKKLNSQLISYDNNYASLELHNAIYDFDKELIKDAEIKLLNILKTTPSISVTDYQN